MHYRARLVAVCACACVLGALPALVRSQGTYQLGPGDQIGITVFGEADLSMDVRLGDSGYLSYPFLGDLRVEGLTVGDLEQQIASGLKGPYLVDPKVTITVLEYRPFYVHGEVQNPGGIAYQPRLTIARAIALAGGFTERASRSKIQVVRAADPSDAVVGVSLSDPVFPGDIITVSQSFF